LATSWSGASVPEPTIRLGQRLIGAGAAFGRRVAVIALTT
jgi:hypothetical protein